MGAEFAMPANLTAQYHKAEERFRAATTDDEKLAGLEEMLRHIPKHKGTEKMQADIKRRIKKLRSCGGKKGGTRHAAPVYYVKKEGAGQIALAGPPNSGKSSLLAKLTHASPEVADYPFTTRLPQPGMMPFENIQIQLVDLPPLDLEYSESWVPQAVRAADAVAVVVNLGDADVLEHLTGGVEILEEAKIAIGRKREELPHGFAHKPTLVVANGSDAPGAKGTFEAFFDLEREKFKRFLMVSAATGEGLEELQRAFFELLDVVRVHTKTPGKKAEMDAPYTLPRGATVHDVAEHVHKDIASGFKYARIWGGGKYDGQMVQRDYVVEDNDVIELHG